MSIWIAVGVVSYLLLGAYITWTILTHPWFSFQPGTPLSRRLLIILTLVTGWFPIGLYIAYDIITKR